MMWNVYSGKATLLILLSLLFGCNLFEKEFILPVPIATNATGVNSVSFRAHWKKVTGASGYEIDVALDKEFTSFVKNYQAKQVSETSISVEGLASNTSYYYRVRAKISNQTSKSSNSIEVTTEQLAVPVAYPATDVGATGFRIHWKKMPIVTNYQVEVAEDNSFTKLLSGYSALEVPAEDTSLLVSNVPVNKQYFYRVRIKQDDSFSEYSNIQSTFTSTLTAPVVLPASKIELTSFVANWEALSEAEYYYIDVAKDALFQQKLTGYDNLKVSSNSLILPDLDANTEYYYRVRAVNGEATSNHSEIMLVTTQNLGTPITTTATEIQSGGFKANWTTVANVASYLVYISLDKNFTQVLPKYNGFQVINNYLAVNELDASTTYYYRVSANGLNATSAYSNITEVTTSLLPAPTATAATNQTVFEFTANWQVQIGIGLYVLDVATDPGFANLVTGYNGKEVAGTSHKVENLDYKKNYYYRLRSKRLSKVSSYSNTIAVNSCITSSCKLDSIKFFTGTTLSGNTQRYIHDAQGRLTQMITGKSSFSLTTYDITYNADNTIQKVRSTQVSWFTRINEYDYSYSNGNLMSITKKDASGNFEELWEFGYNSMGQRTYWRTYSTPTKVTLGAEFNYVYNAKGQVIEIVDNRNVVLRRYGYDEKLSPLVLLPSDLSFFISTNQDKWLGSGVFRGFLPVNNVIKEEIISFGSSRTEVFIFQYSPKEVALEQNGFLSAQYVLSGCSF